MLLISKVVLWDRATEWTSTIKSCPTCIPSTCARPSRTWSKPRQGFLDSRRREHRAICRNRQRPDFRDSLPACVRAGKDQRENKFISHSVNVWLVLPTSCAARQPFCWEKIKRCTSIRDLFQVRSTEWIDRKRKKHIKAAVEILSHDLLIMSHVVYRCAKKLPLLHSTF